MPTETREVCAEVPNGCEDGSPTNIVMDTAELVEAILVQDGEQRQQAQQRLDGTMKSLRKVSKRLSPLADLRKQMLQKINELESKRVCSDRLSAVRRSMKDLLDSAMETRNEILRVERRLGWMLLHLPKDHLRDIRTEPPVSKKLLIVKAEETVTDSPCPVLGSKTKKKGKTEAKGPQPPARVEEGAKKGESAVWELLRDTRNKRLECGRMVTDLKGLVLLVEHLSTLYPVCATGPCVFCRDRWEHGLNQVPDDERTGLAAGLVEVNVTEVGEVGEVGEDLTVEEIKALVSDANDGLFERYLNRLSTEEESDTRSRHEEHSTSPDPAIPSNTTATLVFNSTSPSAPEHARPRPGLDALPVSRDGSDQLTSLDVFLRTASDNMFQRFQEGLDNQRKQFEGMIEIARSGALGPLRAMASGSGIEKEADRLSKSIELNTISDSSRQARLNDGGTGSELDAKNKISSQTDSGYRQIAEAEHAHGNRQKSSIRDPAEDIRLMEEQLGQLRALREEAEKEARTIRKLREEMQGSIRRDD